MWGALRRCWHGAAGAARSTLPALLGRAPPPRRQPAARLLSGVSLASLRPARGSTKKRTRVGRGRGAGGRQCGRGNSGQKSRSGPGIPRGFEGGQTPLHKRLPKLRRQRAVVERPHTAVSLGRLQRLIDTQRLRADRPIDLVALHRAGIRDLVRSGPRPGGIAVTAGGAMHFRARVHVQASAFAPEAAARIEDLGGTAAAVFHDHASLRRILKFSHISPTREEQLREESDRLPLRLRLPPHEPPMTATARFFYSSLDQRGYLHPEVQRRLVAEDPSFLQRYRLAVPAHPHPKPAAPRLCDIVPGLREEGLLPQ